jgi:hypothetical protein
MNTIASCRFVTANLGPKLSEDKKKMLREWLEKCKATYFVRERSINLFINPNCNANITNSPDANGNYWLDVFANSKNFTAELLPQLKKLCQFSGWQFTDPFDPEGKLARLFPLEKIIGGDREQAFLVNDAVIKSLSTSTTADWLDAPDETLYFTDYNIVEKVDAKKTGPDAFILIPNNGPFANLYLSSQGRNEIEANAAIKNLVKDENQIWFEAV